MKRKLSNTTPNQQQQQTKNDKQSKGEKKSTRRTWTDKEDEAIKALINLHGPKNWTSIANKLKEEFGVEGRTGKQCRERY